MSNDAAKALRTVLGNMEAAFRLMSNREMVVKDFVNAGPTGLKGRDLTQTNLTRVSPENEASVAKMIAAVIDRLLSKGVSAPSSTTEALVWMQAATFLSGRIQGSYEECPGRKADMSPYAATALKTVLAQIEAGSKLMSNREKVVKDIVNQGKVGVNGGELTQLNLKRVDATHQGSVESMVREVIGRLFGNKVSEPKTASEANVWAEAASFFNSRIQASAAECPGRAPDMSLAAAKALGAVLAQVPNRTKMSSAAATELSSAVQDMFLNTW
jgi:hypothetical protein